MRLILRAFAEINAPIERVHEILIDFARYGEWSTFVRAISGEARVGAVVTLDVFLPNGWRERARNQIEVLEAPGDRAELTWRFLGPLARLGLVRATRRQTLVRLTNDKTRYETEETFTGLFLAFLPRAALQQGFEDTAASLKKRAEQEVLQ